MPRTEIVSLHHEVLIPWTEWRHTHVVLPRVISFDFHTDTLSCVHRGIAAPESGCWTDPETVARAVREIHHDEHFDWALQAGLVSHARILSIAPQNGSYTCENLEVSRYPGLPDVNVLLNKPETFRQNMKKMLSSSWLSSVLREYCVSETAYILDIDCDFFVFEGMLDFFMEAGLDELAHKAALITLSRESDWVRLLRLPGETITGESIASNLKKRWDK